MKPLVFTLALILISGCSSNKPSGKQHDIRLANPASIHCIRIGGTIDVVSNERNEPHYCNLPSGERVEEWALYHRDSRG
ncbi:putative hemolysin [Klebsiella aerogenes]